MKKIGRRNCQKRRERKCFIFCVLKREMRIVKVKVVSSGINRMPICRKIPIIQWSYFFSFPHSSKSQSIEDDMDVISLYKSNFLICIQ
jgi:hypothetical protein